MRRTLLVKALAALTLLAAGGAQAEEVVRLGNLKLAHFGAVSYIKEIAPRCGIRVEEKVFAKGLNSTSAPPPRKRRSPAAPAARRCWWWPASRVAAHGWWRARTSR
jgi:hypothetical protein